MRAPLTNSPITPAIETAAAEWLVRRNGVLAAADAAALDRWLAADERHRAAFAELEAAWSALKFPSQIGQADEARRQLDARAAGRKRRRLAVAGAAAALVMMGILGVATTRLSSRAPVAAASVALRPDAETLPDGSVIERNAGAELTVDFTPTVRAIRLERGEVLFTVKKDATRPFVVTAGGVTVRAVGTAFAVQHGTAHVNVLVTEGRVAVQHAEAVAAAVPAAVPAPILVSAGGRLEVPVDPASVPVGAVQPFSAAQISAALAWRGHRVEFTHTTLAEAVALFNGQNRLQIAIADAGVARITISGIFWADDPESFVRLVESGFGVRATRAGETIALHGR